MTRTRQSKILILDKYLVQGISQWRLIRSLQDNIKTDVTK